LAACVKAQREARAEVEQRSQGSTKVMGSTWTSTGIVIGEAPNPVTPNIRYPAKITSATRISASGAIWCSSA